MDRLSIRPSIVNQESLTSFLLRVCVLNCIDIKDLFNEIMINYKKPDIRNAHQIDVNPNKTINLKLLKELLNLDQSFLHKNTFYGVINKFTSKDEKISSMNNNSTLIKSLFSIKNRKFCPLCIQDRITYKLKWQVRDILTCSIHQIPLSSSCSRCRMEQPYLHMGLAKGICCFCNNNLSAIHSLQLDKDSLLYSYWLDKQWDELVTLNTSLFTNYNKHISIKLLFVLGNMKKHFTLHNVDQINRDYKFKILNILRNNYSEVNDGLGLNILFKLLWRLDYSINEFLSMSVPEEFQNSLNEYLFKTKYSLIKCISPWCKFYESKDNLMEISSIKSKTHHNLHICLGCCVKFGFNKKSGVFEEYGDLICLGFSTILPLLNRGEKLFSLAKLTGLSRYKIYKLTSYLARFSLINNDYLDSFIPDNINTITIEDIQRISNKNETIMRQSAKKNLNIGINNFYYYYFDPVIQKEIFLSNRVMNKAK